MALWLDEIDLSDIWAEYRHKDLHDFEIFSGYRDKVASRFLAHEWGEDWEWDFSASQDIEEFNSVLSCVYDAADAERVWIKTF